MQYYESLFTSSYGMVSKFAFVHVGRMEMFMGHFNCCVLTIVFPGISYFDGIWKIFCIVKFTSMPLVSVLSKVLMLTDFLFSERLRNNLTFVVIYLCILQVYDINSLNEYICPYSLVNHGNVCLIFILVDRFTLL